MVVSNTIGKGDTRTRKGTHMGQSFVRVNRVIGEKKKVATVKSRESLFRRDDRNRCRIERLSRAPTRSRARDGAPGGGRGGSRRAGASAVCRRDTDLCGSARPASRVPRAESLRALDILFGGTSACAVDGTRMTESARAYGSRKGGSTANALGVPQTGGVRQSQPRGAHAFPHGRGAVGAVARHGRVWSCEAEKRKRLLLERDAGCAVW